MELKDCVVSIRVSTKSLKKWRESAESENVYLSRWVRCKLDGVSVEGKRKLFKPRSTTTRTADPVLIREIARIGNNLNQLAKLLNTRNENSMKCLLVLINIEEDLKILLRSYSVKK